MLIPTILLFFSLATCQSQSIISKASVKPKSVKMLVSKKIANNFAGNFAGTHNEKEIFVSLKSVPRTNKLNGVLTMDGKQARITATKSNNFCTGKIVEDDTNKSYYITAEIVNRKLHFNITFPEYNNQVLALILDRSTLATNGNSSETSINTTGGNVISSVGTGTSSKKFNRDRAMVGKWRFTEVISSGSGEFYASFSTDYFVQFDANGDCFSWAGKSAGGSGDVNFDSNDSSNVDKAQWYTLGKNVVFVNRNTNKEMTIPYFAEENRMILKGQLNRVYVRIE